ncbi:MAG: transglutaminase family protein [Sphingomonadales bacterium]|nr:transglutaminase family protein [Sphingomonadales bacterium]MDE2570605.1 transglutaminase family protein [Sphingomonadales bacterium]
MRLAVDHVTRYRFEAPVYHGLQRLRLTPKHTSGQRVLDWDMALEGAKREVEYEDHNYNRVTLISLDEGTREVVIRCTGTVDTADAAGVIGRHAGFLPLWHFLRPTELTRPGPQVRSLLSEFDACDERLPLLHALSARIGERVAYEGGHTDTETSAEDALAAGHGVCQDHAHVFITACRVLEIPARYVSGYLMMDDRVEQEAGHAWAEAHVDHLGWVGFDVSNGICPDARYVRVATGADYREAAPVTGIRFGTHGEELHVSLAVAQQRMEQ